MKERKPEVFVLPIIMLISAIAQIFTWSTGHTWGDDFSAYIMQAISLTDGSAQLFIERNAFTINESSTPAGPVTYPWGFPILLAPVFAVFGMDIIAFKGFLLLFFLGFLVVLWFLFKDELEVTERAFFVSIFAFNPYFFRFGDAVLSDTPFLFFSTLSVFVFSLLHKLKSTYGLYGLAVWLGISFAAAAAIRTNGILLPLTYAVVLVLFIGRSVFPFKKAFDTSWFSISETRIAHRYTIYAIPLAVFAILIWMLGLFLPDYQSSHLSRFELVGLKSLAGNMLYYGVLIREFFGWPPLNVFLYLLSVPLFLLGLREKWRISTTILIYVFLTFVLYIVWPYRQGLRFLFPVLPFYLYFVFVGLGSFGKAIGRFKFSRVAAPSALVVILALQSSWQLYLNVVRGGVLNDGPYTKDAQEMFAFINQTVPKKDIVVFRKPRVMRLFTDRDSLRYKNIADFKYRQWYVIDKKNREAFESHTEGLFAAYPASLVFENVQFEVFKFD